MQTDNQTPRLSQAERDQREEQQRQQMRDAAAASAKRTADLKEEEKRREAKPVRQLSPEQQTHEKSHRDAIERNNIRFDGAGEDLLPKGDDANGHRQ